MLINGGAAPPNSVPGLRGHPIAIPTSASFDLSLSDLKMSFCKRVMDTCSDIISYDKACHTPGQCSKTYTDVVMPVTHTVCSFLSDQCADLDLDEAVEKLYSAGALSVDIKDTEQIDSKIRELNELKDKIKKVTLGAHAEQAKKARDKYLQERIDSHKVTPKSSKGGDAELGKNLDVETPTV
ncbi:hypothetical protein TpMuguga_02g00914 [Theileria parva strain Muguga]|uniref:Uncharacterized protein n=1 Tax=Theileria parva TaxID=5875 RepID=Q4N3S4_THEPA|nr:uncharacterized protein TpMuguga_02g00910 [Theileria parva strain Muguga]XP_765482.1 uncharacterized protein TpMuguga_02g00914 [Theileria parva strain Muguga]EAN33195.1 hypothetical protein TpMuguga_02g00910 [Theileria parva strain Muguga]EAN33199.1 hypothetical protein TpMuguga_02g00914 [Theileria parva strain Muguga]|eukprot:XP_765478.1 hypothetical protein [Theileria parva strain Muguga]